MLQNKREQIAERWMKQDKIAPSRNMIFYLRSLRHTLNNQSDYIFFLELVTFWFLSPHNG